MIVVCAYFAFCRVFCRVILQFGLFFPLSDMFLPDLLFFVDEILMRVLAKDATRGSWPYY